MSNYAEHVAGHLRIFALRFLDDAPARTANASILTSAAREFGLPATRDRVETELAWLAEQGLIKVEKAMKLSVATLTNRGADVAQGMATVPGVHRPSAAD